MKRKLEQVQTAVGLVKNPRLMIHYLEANRVGFVAESAGNRTKGCGEWVVWAATSAERLVILARIVLRYRF